MPNMLGRPPDMHTSNRASSQFTLFPQFLPLRMSSTTNLKNSGNDLNLSYPYKLIESGDFENSPPPQILNAVDVGAFTSENNLKNHMAKSRTNCLHKNRVCPSDLKIISTSFLPNCTTERTNFGSYVASSGHSRIHFPRPACSDPEARELGLATRSRERERDFLRERGRSIKTLDPLVQLTSNRSNQVQAEDVRKRDDDVHTQEF